MNEDNSNSVGEAASLTVEEEGMEGAASSHHNSRGKSDADTVDIAVPTTAAIQAAAAASAKRPIDPKSRGDPRMNRAVEAKLNNPHCSLSDALHVGGFRYPPRADATAVDDEDVTLGQRKNQLNRRLRKARIDQLLHDRNTGANNGNRDGKRGEKQGDQDDGSSISSSTASSSKHTRKRGRVSWSEQQKQVESVTSSSSSDRRRRRNSLPGPVNDEQQQDSSVPLESAVSGVAEQIDSDTLQQQFPQQHQSLMEVSPSLISSSFYPGLSQEQFNQQQPQQQHQQHNYSQLAQNLQQQQQQQQSLSQHTQNLQQHHQNYNQQSQSLQQQQQHILMLQQQQQQQIEHLQQLQQDNQMQQIQLQLQLQQQQQQPNHVQSKGSDYESPTTHASNNATPPYVSGGSSSNESSHKYDQNHRNIRSSQHEHNRNQISNVMVQTSINNGSDSNPHLNHQQQQHSHQQHNIQGTNNNNSNNLPLFNERQQRSNREGDRMELGLGIFRSQLSGLYQRSMLQAGFAHHECDESSQAYHTFAFLAWKNECERLSAVMTDGSATVSSNGINEADSGGEREDAPVSIMR